MQQAPGAFGTAGALGNGGRYHADKSCGGSEHRGKAKSTREIFSDQDIAAIKKSGVPAADIALILISCGCRPGELFNVPLVNCREDHFIGGSKTEAGKNRVIPIGSDGIAAYQKMRVRAIEKEEPC